MIMRIFLLILILIINPQSWTKADDIRDFQIEGMSIGDTLLDFMTINEIELNIVNYFEDKRKYYVVRIINSLNQYDQIEIYLKSNDKKYEIKSILAGLYEDDLDKCLEKKKEIVKDLDNIFSNIKKVSGKKNHEIDITGKSKQYIDQYNIDFPNHIRVECTQMSKEIINAGLGSNSLNVIAMTKEVWSWVENGYK